MAEFVTWNAIESAVDRLQGRKSRTMSVEDVLNASPMKSQYQFAVSIAASSRAEEVMKEMLALFSDKGHDNGYNGGGGIVEGMSRAERAKSGFFTGGKGETDSEDEYSEYARGARFVASSSVDRPLLRIADVLKLSKSSNGSFLGGNENADFLVIYGAAMCVLLKDLSFVGVCTSDCVLDFTTSCLNEASKPTFLAEVLKSD